MKIGISSGAYPGKYGLEAGFDRMKAHGYDCLDYQGFVNTADPLFRLPEAEFCKTLQAYKVSAENAGVQIWQVHAPWQWPAAMDQRKEDREYQLLHYAKAVRGAAYLGAEYFAVHHIMPQGEKDTDPEYVKVINTEFFGALAQTAKEYGVTLCMENMPFGGQCLARTKELLAFVKQMDHSHIKMCLDTGHSMVLGMQPAEAVRMIGKDYLKILHVHDNDGMRDSHWVPYTGVIDWEDFAKALREIGFDGCLSLETEAGVKDLSAEAAWEKELELACCARKMSADV